MVIKLHGDPMLLEPGEATCDGNMVYIRRSWATGAALLVGDACTGEVARYSTLDDYLAVTA